MLKPAFWLTLLPLMGCSSSYEPSVPVNIVSIPESYTMRVSQKCFCQSELQGPFDIRVVRNKVLSVQHTKLDMVFPLRLVGDEIPNLKSILASIERANAQGNYQKNITWIKEPFVPKHVYIDFYKNIRDDEIDITIEAFKAL